LDEALAIRPATQCTCHSFINPLPNCTIAKVFCLLIVAVIGFGVSVQDQQTCNQTGTFTVLDNQHFSIIAEAEPIPSVQVRAREFTCVWMD